MLTDAGFEPVVSAEFEGEYKELGRVIADHAGSTQCFELAKEWLHRCTSSHGEACALDKQAPLPTRLVHVPSEADGLLKLCHTKGMTGQYVALSYCWGQGCVTFTTTKETLEDRLSGFRIDELPTLLQDAVKIARSFGIEWIWIDALCILQYDAADWSQESARMAEVYGNSVFTIGADFASSTDESILRPRDLAVSHQFGPTEEFRLQRISLDWDAMCWHALYKRGWAFQERILTPRVLHFLEDQIAWECNVTLYREGFRGRQTSPPLHFAKSAFSAFYHQKRYPKGPPLSGNGDDIDLHGRLQKWGGVVQEMSVRHFTVDADTLAAVSGLASAFQTPELGQYFAGVWECNPFMSMVWHMRYPQPRLEVYRAPSWSWAWTDFQLIWHAYPYKTDSSAEEIAIWRRWNEKWAPRLVSQHMVLETQDPKGRVLEGSHLIMSGFCRDIFIAEHPGTQYHEWMWVEWEDQPGEAAEAGMYAYMDRWENGHAFASGFEADLDKRYPEIDASTIKQYLCVQCVQERRGLGTFCKTLALVLEQAEGGTSFRRVGLVSFDFDEAEGDAWERRELKLI
jgi:hypothetical protein